MLAEYGHSLARRTHLAFQEGYPNDLTAGPNIIGTIPIAFHRFARMKCREEAALGGGWVSLKDLIGLLARKLELEGEGPRRRGADR